MNDSLNKVAIQFADANREAQLRLCMEIDELKSILIAIILQEQLNKNDYNLYLKFSDVDMLSDLTKNYELVFKDDRDNRCTKIGVVKKKTRDEILAKLTKEEIEILGVS